MSDDYWRDRREHRDKKRFEWVECEKCRTKNYNLKTKKCYKCGFEEGAC